MIERLVSLANWEAIIGFIQKSLWMSLEGLKGSEPNVLGFRCC